MFTGYIPWAAAQLNDNPATMVWLLPDPWQPGFFTCNDAIKVEGLRRLGESGFPIEMHFLDRAMLNEFRSRSRQFTQKRPNTTPPVTYYDNTASLGAAAAYHPMTPEGRSRIGHPANKFYVTHAHEVRHPERLLVYASARGVDIASRASYGTVFYGRMPGAWSAASKVVPGFWEVTQPGARVPGSWPAWQPGNRFVEQSDPARWGMIHPRYRFGSDAAAVTVMVDGHVAMQSLSDLRDMRKWSNQADRADWEFGQ